MVTIRIDNRGLLPPEPMLRILEAIESIENGDRVVAVMDREPLLLYPELERRGFAWTFEDGEDGSYLLTIQRAGS